MLVVQIDDLDTQPLETGLARADDIFGTAIGDLAVASADVAELGRQDHFGAAPLDGLADEFLVMAGPIGVRRIEQRYAPIQRLANKGNSFRVVACAINAGQRHAAKSDRGCLDA